MNVKKVPMGFVGTEERFSRSRNGERQNMSPGVGTYNINGFSSVAKAAGTNFETNATRLVKTVASNNGSLSPTS